MFNVQSLTTMIDFVIVRNRMSTYTYEGYFFFFVDFLFFGSDYCYYKIR